MMDDQPTLVSAQQLADFLGISRQAVGKHTKAGVLHREANGRYDLAPASRAYAQHLEAVADKRGTGDGVSSAAVERARLTKVRRQLAEIKLAEMRQRFVDVAEVERRWSAERASIDAALLAVVERVRGRLPSLSDDEVAALHDEIGAASPSRLRRRPQAAS